MHWSFSKTPLGLSISVWLPLQGAVSVVCFVARMTVFSFPLPSQTNLAFLSAHSVCHYSRLFWEWGEGVKVHDSQKRQDPEKLSKEDVLSFIQAHYP